CGTVRSAVLGAELLFPRITGIPEDRGSGLAGRHPFRPASTILGAGQAGWPALSAGTRKKDRRRTTVNENLFRTQFDQMETTEKQALMENLAARYNMTFLGLQPFDRWGQSCTTDIFKKDGREYVFVPGDTVT